MLRLNAGLFGVDVAVGPLELDPNPPPVPRFKLDERRTGIFVPSSLSKEAFEPARLPSLLEG